MNIKNKNNSKKNNITRSHKYVCNKTEAIIDIGSNSRVAACIIDLRNTIFNELSSLKAMDGGVILMVAAYIPPYVLEDLESEQAIREYRFYYLTQFECAIIYRKEMSKDASFLENLLQKINELMEEHFQSNLMTKGI